MLCEICGGPAVHYFSKTFNAFNLKDVDYWRCEACGFVISRTHQEMSSAAWSELNRQCHETYQGQAENVLDPRWKARLTAQASALAQLAGGGLLNPQGRWLDFGCGDGALSALCADPYGLKLLKYDAYMPAGDDYLSGSALTRGGFDFVITTSVFEHLTRRSQWDDIEALVAPRGVLGIHTLVAEQVPEDPNWFYLQAPHTAFFTNAAMARLFQDWGYRASIYSVAASLWLWFRSDPKEVQAKMERINATTGSDFLFREGFLDYWKIDPRRPNT